MRNVLWLLIWFLGTAGSSHAAPITMAFSGTINSITRVTETNPFGSGIGIGTPFTGTYSFDTALPNIGDSTYGVYVSASPSMGVNVSAGSYSGVSSTASVRLNYRIITGGLVNNDIIQDIQTQGMNFGGVNAYLAQLFLQAPQYTIDNVGLSATPPNLSLYSVKTFVLGIGALGSADVVYQGEITDIYRVSEPATLALLGLVLAGLALSRFKSKSH
jgi:hypothetical protein